jgi:DNA-binding transcriptional LysR family regulator
MSGLPGYIPSAEGHSFFAQVNELQARAEAAEARVAELEAALEEVRAMTQSVVGCKVSPTVLSALSNIIEECRRSLEAKEKDLD